MNIMDMMDLSYLPWPEVKVPEYAEGEHGMWRIDSFEVPLLRGYWRGLRPVLSRCYRLFKGNEIWMSTTPMELESQQHALACFKGRVVIAGAGMGITIYNAVTNPAVESVTVIEIDEDVIELLERQAEVNDWPNWSKVRWINDDALLIGAAELLLPADFLWVDIWETLGSNRAFNESMAIQRRVNAKEVGWWGMELDFIDYLQNVKKATPPPTRVDWRDFRSWAGIPLMESEEQAERAAEAARNSYLA
jgi:hypothetical protein